VNCRIRLETTIASVRVALRAGLTVAIDVHIGGPEHGSAQTTDRNAGPRIFVGTKFAG
jgi:hypothetical protein